MGSGQDLLYFFSLCTYLYSGLDLYYAGFFSSFTLYNVSFWFQTYPVDECYSLWSKLCACFNIFKSTSPELFHFFDLLMVCTVVVCVYSRFTSLYFIDSSGLCVL